MSACGHIIDWRGHDSKESGEKGEIRMIRRKWGLDRAEGWDKKGGERYS